MQALGTFESEEAMPAELGERTTATVKATVPALKRHELSITNVLPGALARERRICHEQATTPGWNGRGPFRMAGRACESDAGSARAGLRAGRIHYEFFGPTDELLAA